MGFIERLTNKHSPKRTEEELRLHRCAFTGHRPEKLNRSEIEIKSALNRAIQQAINDGYSVFITGMARGVDLWAAEIVLSLRTKNRNLKLICAIPYEGFETRWSEEWQRRYQSVLKQADYVYTVSKGYTPDVFQKRNIWMVNHSNRLIAIYSGIPGGTKNTIEYAHQREIEVIQVL